MTPSAQIRYRRLASVSLNVSNLERSCQFYEEIVGLQRVYQNAEMAMLRCSDFHHDIILHGPSKSPGLRSIGWEMESESALEALQKQLETSSVHVERMSDQEREPFGTDAGLRIIDPTTGAHHEFFTRMRFADSPYQTTHTNLEGLGHIVLSSPDVAATKAFYEETLNFRVSDRIGDVVVHMRCFPNPLHHSFGIGKSQTPGLHHLTFMVNHIDDIGKAVTRLTEAGTPIVYGPGRHPQSGSFFLYFLDPDGLTLEFSQGMEEFPESNPREPRTFPIAVDSFDYWGNMPKQGFAAKGAIA